MVFQITYPTRHTDTYTSTGFVHAGVLLALTELAYAAFEEHCGVSKPDHIVAVQRATEARYRAPLRWDEGASIRVRTLEVSERSFDQAFDVVAATDGRPVADLHPSLGLARDPDGPDRRAFGGRAAAVLGGISPDGFRTM